MTNDTIDQVEMGDDGAAEQDGCRGLSSLVTEVQRVAAERDDLRRQLDVVYSSKSWTLTAPMRRIAEILRARDRPRHKDVVPDLPPTDLRARVTGSEDSEWFWSSGQTALEDISDALASVGRSLEDFERIYDFGCGCGRIILHLIGQMPPTRITGTDSDSDAVAWLKTKLPTARIENNGALPPLPFDDNSFDLIIGWSVFTHLPESYQDEWLAELARVLAPGGVMLQTVHGMSHFDVVEAPEDDPIRTALPEKGIFYLENYGEDSPFASYYQTTYHHSDYIRAHWSQWVDVRNILPGAARPTHDMVVLEAR
jgi:SAM-dependent methyltransferase